MSYWGSVFLIFSSQKLNNIVVCIEWGVSLSSRYLLAILRITLPLGLFIPSSTRYGVTQLIPSALAAVANFQP